MNLKHLQFKASDGFELPALFYKSEEKSSRVAIYLHGSYSSVFYNPKRNKILAEELTGSGISYFFFNNRGANVLRRLKRSVNHLEEQVNFGTAMEEIEDCVKDIEGCLEYLKSEGYTEFYLIGHSTGANKICVYNTLKPENPISKYILVSGGDDTGSFYKLFGKSKFEELLNIAKLNIEHGKGNELINPAEINSMIYSHKGLYNVLNPEGLYNIFPFKEYSGEFEITKKELFGELKKIEKDSLLIYGSDDEYIPGVESIKILKQVLTGKNNFQFELIEGANHSFDNREKELATKLASFLA